MKHKFFALLGTVWLLATSSSLAQKADTPVKLTQQDSRLHVSMYYQKENNTIGGLTQDYKITVQNKTNDKLHIHIEYYADLVCGQRNTHQLGPLGDGYTLKPGETIDKTWLNDGIASYVRILGDKCPKESWKETGTDKNGSKTYSMINNLGYRIVKITNISEQERKEAEVKKQKADAEIARKEEEAKKLKTAGQQSSTETTTPTNATSANQPASSVSTPSTSASSTSTTPLATPSAANQNFKTASQFSGGLDDIKEGDYFKDNSGNYYQKFNGGAQKVEKAVYDKAQVAIMNAQLERQKVEQKEREALYNQAATEIATLTTNVFAGIQADREAAWQRQYESTSRARETIEQMAGLAAEGNEEAMKQVNSAFRTLAWHNKEAKEDWTGTYSETHESFLKETLETTQSPVAYDLLVGFYVDQKENALARKRKGIGRGIGFGLLAGGMGYGSSVAYDKIVTYEDGEFQNETLGDIVLSAGVIGGLTFGVWGIYELANAFINSGSNSEGYKEADRKLNSMKPRISWQVKPQYDTNLKASLLSLKLQF